VFSELGESKKDDFSIIDDQIDLKPTQHLNQLYGLRGGVYESTDIPDTLDCSPGYFGGFILDRTKQTILPVKGFAPNLKHPHSKSNAIEMHQKSSDIELESSAPPQIGGDSWVGYFKAGGSSIREPLTASIVLTGFDVTLETTRTGLGHYFSGTINSNGDMLLYDSYDGEDWTTHYGPATGTLIRIYDYVMLPTSWALNEITLYRLPAPLEVQASDGTCINDKISISWNPSVNATTYDVYACNTSLTDSCTYLSRVSTTRYDDKRTNAGIVYYRIKACNKYGCGEFSDYDTGYYCTPSITSIFELLL